MQRVIPGGTTMVVQAQPASQSKQDLYKNMKKRFSRALIGLGAVQLIIGVLCIVFQGVSLGYFSVVFSFAFVGHGIWNGLLFLITGIFGIVGGCRRSRCEVITFSVFSIISACFATALLGIATPSAILTQCYQFLYRGSYYDGTTTSVDPAYRKCLDSINVVIAMESMLAILALFEGIVAIASSAVCCAIGVCCCGCGGCCCCPKPPPQLQQFTNQWVSNQNQPHHQIIVQTSDTNYEHLYPSSRNTEYTPVGSAPSPTTSDNSQYLEIIYE